MKVDGEGWKRMKADGELKEIHSVDVCRTAGKLTDDEWRKLVKPFTFRLSLWRPQGGGGGGLQSFPVRGNSIQLKPLSPLYSIGKGTFHHGQIIFFVLGCI